MNISDLNLRDLEYVLAVAEHSSFSKAADACSVSQPALSKQIINLEKALHVQLFERMPRQVLLTPLGERFVQEARRVLDQAGQLLMLGTENKLPLSGEFKLGAIASSGPYLIPHFIGALSTQYPQLQLLIKEGLTENLIEDLKKGRLDAVIAAETFEEETLQKFSLFFEPFVVASSKNAGFSKRLDMRDLDLNHILLLEDGHCLKDQTMAFCSLQNSERVFKFQASSLETLLHMTASGLGFSVIPEMAIPKNPDLLKLLNISRFKDKYIGRKMALFARKSAVNDASLEHLAQVIQNNLPR